MARRIVTEHIYPPIPIRGFDWIAWYADEDPEAQRNGYGNTEEAAKTDLVNTYPDEDDGHSGR